VKPDIDYLMHTRGPSKTIEEVVFSAMNYAKITKGLLNQADSFLLSIP